MGEEAFRHEMPNEKEFIEAHIQYLLFLTC